MELKTPLVSVYLSGHMHHEEHDWRETVLVALKDDHIRWLIPKAGPFKAETRQSANFYVPRDLLAVQKADIIFAYVEDLARNVGTAFECGYAKGLGKIVVLVNNATHCHSFDFLEPPADAVFYTLEEGITALRFIVQGEDDSAH